MDTETSRPAVRPAARSSTSIHTRRAPRETMSARRGRYHTRAVGQHPQMVSVGGWGPRRSQRQPCETQGNRVGALLVLGPAHLKEAPVKLTMKSIAIGAALVAAAPAC